MHAQDIPELPSSESVRIYLDELRPELAFKTMFVTPVTTCEEVVSQILRKYNFGGDSSHYVLGVEQENGRTEAVTLGRGFLQNTLNFIDIAPWTRCIQRHRGGGAAADGPAAEGARNVAAEAAIRQARCAATHRRPRWHGTAR